MQAKRPTLTCLEKKIIQGFFNHKENSRPEHQRPVDFRDEKKYWQTKTLIAKQSRVRSLGQKCYVSEVSQAT